MKVPFLSVFGSLLVLGAATTVSAQLRINEFVARNSASITDEDGDHEDWIELTNPSTSPIDLAGWRLTDVADSPAKWVFPSVTILPGEYLLVFASGKDRTVVPGGVLHTNFKLEGNGEYLALIRPDGTVEQAFSPVYPRQVPDVSYGLASLTMGEVVLVGDGYAASALVPSDDSLGDLWKQTGFDDSAWVSGLLGIGYETQPGSITSYAELLGIDLETSMYTLRPTAYVRMSFELDDPLAYTQMTLQMRYDDGFAAFLNGVPIASANAPAVLTHDAVATTTHSDSLALDFVDFDVSAQLGSLVRGTNVLAIQALNRSTTSSDLLCFPQLKVSESLDQGFAYMAAPTPGGANTSGGEGLVKDITFSVGRGYYDTPFEVAITTATQQAEIRYTLDGSLPTETSGTVYANPIPISNTTVLRAIAYRPGYLPSNVDSQTYLFPDSVMQQDGASLVSANWGHAGPDWEMDPEVLNNPDPVVRPTREDLLSLPALSIVMDWGEMFGSGGIYIAGENVERACAVELIDPTGGADEFQVNASVQIVGGTSVNRWKSDKLSMRLKFTEAFGPTKLEYPVFGPDGADQFDTLVIDARLNNVWHYGGGSSPDTQRVRGQYFRDQLVADMQRATGGLSPHGRHVFVFINGVFWGIHTLHERPDDSFAAAYLEGAREEFDAIKHRPSSAVGGTTAAYQEMVSLAAKDLSVPANYQAVANVLDVAGLADYILVNYFVANTDWAHQNWYATRKHTEPAGRWLYHSWDAEHSFESITDDVTGRDDAGGPTGVHQDLMGSPEYRLLFNDRVQRHFRNNGVLTTERAQALYLARADTVDAASRVESARWGDNGRSLPYTRQDWLNERDRILQDFIPARNQAVLQQMQSRGFLLPTPAPQLSHYGGVIAPPIQLVTTSPHTVYLTVDGTDPRAFGTGAPTVPPHSGVLSLYQSTVVKARAYDNGVWSPMVEAVFVVDEKPDIRISEVMFHAHAPEGAETNAGYTAADYDFLELVNAGSEPVGLAGMQIIRGVRFDFTTGLVPVLLPGEHVLVVADIDAFRLRYPGVAASRIAGEFQGSLDNGGETVELAWPGTGASYVFSYGDGRGWYPQTDGAGHSLIAVAHPPELLDYSGHWRPSAYRGGSPGEADPTPIVDVLINEFAAHTDTTVPGYESDDWVELYALPGSTVNPADWYLSDSQDNLLKSACTEPVGPGPRWWAIGEVPAGGSVLRFGLNKDGESVYLTHAPGGSILRVADAATYKGQENGKTLGRFPDGSDSWMILPASRGAANLAPIQDVRIHELLYDHPRGPAYNYIVLHNPTQAPVGLYQVDGPWRLHGDVEFDLPPSYTLGAQSYLTLVFFDPSDFTQRAAFLAEYGLAEGEIDLAGPCVGILPTTGGRIALERPQSPDLPGDPVSWVVVDEAIYFRHDPFPDSAAGTGLSLQRIRPSASGTLPSSWQSGLPTPASGEIQWPPVNLHIDGSFEGHVSLQFEAFTGFHYELEVIETIGQTNWVRVLSVSTNGPVTHTDVTDAPIKSYRVRQAE